MAVMQSRDTRTVIAGADLSAAQFKFVKLDAAAEAVLAGGAVASDAAGLCVDAAATDIIMGYATEAGVTSQIIAIELIQGGNAAA